MTPYFRSYATNFNRVRLLEMIDYRKEARRPVQPQPANFHNILGHQIHAEAPDHIWREPEFVRRR